LPATSTHPAWQRVEVYLLKESAVSDTVRFLTADLPQPPRVLTSATQPGPDVVVILPANADPDLVAFARAMLGSTAIEITPTPTLPVGSEPIVRVFARGDHAIAMLREL